MDIDTFVFRLVEIIDFAKPRKSNIDEFEARIRDRHNHQDILTNIDVEVLDEAVEHLRNLRLTEARKILWTFLGRRTPKSMRRRITV